MIPKKTKIIATLGPSSSNPEVIRKMILSGMNVARLNFSHGNFEEKEKLIKTVRSLAKELDTPVAILADLQGPKMRLGKFEGKQKVKVGERLELSVSPKNKELPIQFDLSRFVIEGHRIFINDGLIELVVTSVKDQTIETKVISEGEVSSNKGINIPDTKIGVAAFTEKDKEDAVFALKQNVDFLALSFVEKAGDLLPLTNLISELNPAVKTIVKIERREALTNLDTIIRSADAVMVARGDLATETSPSEIPVYQQKIVRLARQAEKPVIIATQMLESMTENPRPTRAEVSDVANAVFIQADAVMLSAETASGDFPVKAVATMSEIISSVEEHPDFGQYIRINWESFVGKNLEVNAIAASSALLSFRLNSSLIAVASATGRTVIAVSTFRPNAGIFAVAHDEKICNQLALIWGVNPVKIKTETSTDLFWENITKEISRRRLVETPANIVLVGGSANIGVPGATDTIKVVSLV